MRLLNLPNFFTLLNLFSGCMAVVFTFSYRLEWVPACIAISLIADFFDGLAARALKTPQGIGLQLDSLADMVSFGVLPSSIIYHLLHQFWETRNLSESGLILASAPAYLFALCAALRLAKFNVDERQTSGFIGLATPAATIFVVGTLLVFLHNTYGLSSFIFQPTVLYGMLAALGALMLSEIPMFSFKLKKLSWSGNEIQILFVLAVAVLVATLKFAAIPLSIVLYIIFSLFQPLLKK